MEIMRRLVQEEEGQGLVEYALIIALVGVLLIASLKTFRTDIGNIFSGIQAKITAGQ